MRVMSHNILTADRGAHVRMVAVSLACAIVFVAAMIGVRISDYDRHELRAEAPLVVKAMPATTWSSNQTAGAVR
jgi:hypothetical protein